MTIYFIIFGENANKNKDNSNFYDILTTGNLKYDKTRAKTYPDLINLMEKCLQPDPDDRPTAPELLMLPMFKKYVKENF